MMLHRPHRSVAALALLVALGASPQWLAPLTKMEAALAQTSDPAASPSLPVAPSGRPPATSQTSQNDLPPGWVWLLAALGAGAVIWASRRTQRVTDHPEVSPPAIQTEPESDNRVSGVEPGEPPVVESPILGPDVSGLSASDPGLADLPSAPEPEALPIAPEPSPIEVSPQPSETESSLVTAPPPTVPADAGVDLAALAGGAALAAGGAAVIGAMAGHDRSEQTDAEAARFDMGQTTNADAAELGAIDAGLTSLPGDNSAPQMMLMPRDPHWAYAYWTVSEDMKATVRQQGGQQLALRLYEVTSIDMTVQRPPNVQQYACDELAKDWYLPVPVSDRDYIAELGYIGEDDRWLMIVRSNPCRVPPLYPTEWYDDQFMQVSWEEELQGKTFLDTMPAAWLSDQDEAAQSALFDYSQATDAQRRAGSIFGSMQPLGSGEFPSGVGMSGVGMSGIGMSGVGMSGVGMSGIGMSGVGMSGIGMSGIGMSGIGMSGVGMSGVGMSGIGMSGIGFSASMPPIRPRRFWLVADAELIVYGATEPDATLTIDGKPIKLNPDGTFRLQMAFSDGQMRFPIIAVAADGEQTRSVDLHFRRDTPSRHTNTPEEAVDEWFRPDD